MSASSKHLSWSGPRGILDFRTLFPERVVFKLGPDRAFPWPSSKDTVLNSRECLLSDPIGRHRCDSSHTRVSHSLVVVLLPAWAAILLLGFLGAPTLFVTRRSPRSVDADTGQESDAYATSVSVDGKEESRPKSEEQGLTRAWSLWRMWWEFHGNARNDTDRYGDNASP